MSFWFIIIHFVHFYLASVADAESLLRADHRMGVGRPYSTSPFAATPIQVHMNTNSASSTIRSAIWRIIIFQLYVVPMWMRVIMPTNQRLFCFRNSSFTLILVLASISTLIDVIAHHTQPTPFGTQHVALLLAAWGPVIVFGECFARFPDFNSFCVALTVSTLVLSFYLPCIPGYLRFESGFTGPIPSTRRNLMFWKRPTVDSNL